MHRGFYIRRSISIVTVDRRVEQSFFALNWCSCVRLVKTGGSGKDCAGGFDPCLVNGREWSKNDVVFLHFSVLTPAREFMSDCHVSSLNPSCDKGCNLTFPLPPPPSRASEQSLAMPGD